LEQVNDDHTHVEITSKHGSAVLMSLDEYEAAGDRIPAPGARERAAGDRVPCAGRRGTRRPARSRPAVRLVFTDHGWDDYQYWAANDRRTLKRLNRLVEEALRSPFDGIGKPKPL
jgi:prevent-host-death family protein